MREQGEGIAPPVPRRRLIEQQEEIDAVLLGDGDENGIDILCGQRGRVAAPDAHVELRMGAAEIARDREYPPRPVGERQQEERFVEFIARHTDERLQSARRTDVAVPRLDPVAPAEGRRAGATRGEPIPGGSSGREIVEYLDAADLGPACTQDLRDFALHDRLAQRDID